MKSKSVLSFLIVIITGVSVTFSSCKKSDPSSASGFTWVYNDTTYTAVVHKGFTGSMAATPIIIGSRSSSIRPSPSFVTIGVSSFNTGTYTFSNTSPNHLQYNDSGGYNNFSTTGSVNITSSANNLLSGNFSATVINSSSGETHTITGNFSGTSVEP